MKLSNTVVRLIVGIIGIPLILVLVFNGNVPFLLFCMLTSLLCMNEFYNLFESPKKEPSILTGWLGGFSFEKLVFLTVSSLIVLCIYFERINYVLILYFLIFIYLIVAEIFKTEKHFEAIGTWLMSVLYISTPFGLLALMASDKFISFFGFNYSLIGLIMIWVSDTFAFWGGKQFGKHKLAERISPKKTWEGSILGFTFTIISGVVLYLFYGDKIGLVNILSIAVIVGFTAQIGDLFESYLKRTAQVKDSSQLIPGHGGFLDRFDSLLFVTPALYIYLYLKSTLF
jgi:phosphatidate cytidylyltransferase